MLFFYYLKSSQSLFCSSQRLFLKMLIVIYEFANTSFFGSRQHNYKTVKEKTCSMLRRGFAIQKDA